MSHQFFRVIIPNHLHSIPIGACTQLHQLIWDALLIGVWDLWARSFVVNVEFASQLALIDGSVHAFAQFLVFKQLVLGLEVVHLRLFKLFVQLVAPRGDHIGLTATAKTQLRSEHVESLSKAACTQRWLLESTPGWTRPHTLIASLLVLLVVELEHFGEGGRGWFWWRSPWLLFCVNFHSFICGFMSTKLKGCMWLHSWAEVLVCVLIVLLGWRVVYWGR